MDTMQIANKLVSLCKEGKNREALETLFAEHIVSVEAGAPPGMQRESKGLAAVKAKALGGWTTMRFVPPTSPAPGRTMSVLSSDFSSM